MFRPLRNKDGKSVLQSRSNSEVISSSCNSLFTNMFLFRRQVSLSILSTHLGSHQPLGFEFREHVSNVQLILFPSSLDHPISVVHHSEVLVIEIEIDSVMNKSNLVVRKGSHVVRILDLVVLMDLRMGSNQEIRFNDETNRRVKRGSNSQSLVIEGLRMDY